MLTYKLEYAECIIRVFTGILFFFQGYDKVFKIRMSGVIDNFLEDAEQIHIHRPVVSVIAYCTSFIELMGGLFLAIGLFTNYALLALGFDLVLVCFAFSIIRPMWDMQHVFPRLLLVSGLLFIPDQYTKIALDYFLTINK